jgi:predicted XRE-type DNA-binding protein
MSTHEKPLEWIGSSHKDLMDLPADVRRFFGFALSLAQSGDKHDAAKVLKGFGGAGVLEVIEDDAAGTYRAVYTGHCHTKRGHGHHPCKAENCRGLYKGFTKMKTQIIEGIEVHHSSGNVFSDLGLVDAEKLKIKTGLVIEIRKAIKARNLSQQVAAKLMGISQPKVSDMMRGDFANLSERKLMVCLTRLGYDIEIKVRPAKDEIGHLMLTAC